MPLSELCMLKIKTRVKYGVRPFGEAMGYKYNGLWKKARSAGFSN